MSTIPVITCKHCGRLLHRGYDKKRGCTQCGRKSSTIGEHMLSQKEKGKIADLIIKSLKVDQKMTIYLTRPTF